MNENVPAASRLPFGLSGAVLKNIALLTMLIDHTGLVFVLYGLNYHGYPIFINGTDYLPLIYHIMRNIGRIAFPIYLFLLVQGFIHTHNRKAYALRLFLFACISEIPFNLALSGKLFSWEYQNVFWTLLAGFLMMWGIESLKKTGMNPLLKSICILALAGAVMAAVTFCHTDYDWNGILSLLILYHFRYNRLDTVILGAVSFVWEPWAILAFIPICLYNGKRGRQAPKYFFYAFYPAHLLLLVCINLLLFGSII